MHYNHSPSSNTWQRLGRGLRYLTAACQPLRQRGGCNACARACPVDALQVAETPMLDGERCMACGLCVPACPMGALDLPGARLNLSVLSECEEIRVDCWRVPASVRAALAVPCLGALDSAALLELCHFAERVVLLDHGWCATCPAGSQPAQAALEQATALLTDLGLTNKSVRRLSQPLPIKFAAPEIPAASAVAPMSRRDFFRRTATLAQESLSVPQARLRAPVHPSLARQRHISALNILTPTANDIGHPVLRVSEACRNHQVCAPVCPTGALQVYQENSTSSLRYDPKECIACGLCACPEHALHFSPSGGTAEIRVLTSFSHYACRECGGACLDEDSLCSACERDQAFAGQAFAQLFGRKQA
jgi:ferredoxin